MRSAEGFALLAINEFSRSCLKQNVLGEKKKKKDGSFKLGAQNEANYEILPGRISVNKKTHEEIIFFIAQSEVYGKVALDICYEWCVRDLVFT